MTELRALVLVSLLVLYVLEFTISKMQIPNTDSNIIILLYILSLLRF